MPPRRALIACACLSIPFALAACADAPRPAPADATEPPAALAAADASWLWNTNCPKSGRPVVRDRDDCYFEYEGVRVYFCNPDCAAEGAQDPETWIARAYPNGRPAPK